MVRGERRDRVVVITLDRPKVNAYEIGLMSELRAAVAAAEAERASEVALLAERSGRIASFPAGARLLAAELYEEAGADSDATHLYRTLAESSVADGIGFSPEAKRSRAAARSVATGASSSRRLHSPSHG